MTVWSLAKKEFTLLLRDWRAALILVAMPLLFILVLGLLLGEAFGQKPDDKLRVIVLDLDQKPEFFRYRGQVSAALASAPAGPLQLLPALDLPQDEPWPGLVRGRTWAEEVRNDLKDTAGIRLEVIESREEAERLVREHRQAAILVFEPTFSNSVCNCSFLVDGTNPFYRDGVELKKVGATLLRDERQPAQAGIIEQVAQVSLLRVLLPYMIGKAFDRLSKPEFIELLGKRVNLPVPPRFQFIVGKDQLTLMESLEFAAEQKPAKIQDFKEKVGAGVQAALKKQFENYDLTGMTWEKLTRSKDPRQTEGVETPWVNKEGSGILKRGAYRYQLLVPSYTVMFSFFLVMNVGWLFVAERRQGTLKRLRASPLTRGQILLGKLLPCFILSLVQGILLLIAGRFVFGMRWGPASWSLGQQVLWLLPVVVATSLAATGMAMIVAALARTEVQVALYGAVPVLVLALIGGCVLPKEMMPESTQVITLFTPQGWALEAYRELLDPNPTYMPNLRLVLESCGILTAFGAGFIALAWWLLPLD
jgi:ABC-type Na+ efflux pump permease subunit